MIQIQVVPRAGHDAYTLVRRKVLHAAATWAFANKAKSRIKHIRRHGHLEVANAGGILVARVVPKGPGEEFYLAEKFIGRMVAWFPEELAGVNVQFLPEAPKRVKRR